MSEGPRTFHPHVSPDGSWRWDGHAWVRADLPSPGVAPEPSSAPHAPVRPPGPDPVPAAGPAESEATPPVEAEEGVATRHEGSDTGEVPRTRETGAAEEEKTEAEANRTGWLMIGGLIGASLVVLAAIIGAALLLYRAAGSPPPNPQTTAAPARPPNPADLPYHYLAGVTVGHLTASLEAAGFSCAAPTPVESNLRDWRCDRVDGSQREIVQIWAADHAHVTLVDATVVAESGSVDATRVRSFYAQVVDLLYPASSSHRGSVTAWVADNADRTATTAIGSVTLRTQRTDVATLLEFDAGRRH